MVAEAFPDADPVGEPLSPRGLTALYTRRSPRCLCPVEEAQFPAPVYSTPCSWGGGGGVCNKPQALIPPDCSRVFSLHYLATEVRRRQQSAGSEPSGWTKG